MRTLRILLVAAACVTRLTAGNALHLGFMAGAAGSEIEIPVMRSGSDPAGGASVDFRFDPARMEFKGVAAGAAAAGWTLDSEQTVATEVRLLLTHPTGAQLPVGELARVRVKLLETFPHSEATGTALVRRELVTPAAALASALWLPWLEITAPTAGSHVSNSTAGTVSFRVSPGERPLTALALQLAGGTVLTAPSPAARSFLWQPNLSAGGLLDLAVSATDDEAHSFSSAAVAIVINTPPTLAAIGDRSVNELAPLAFTASATDADVPANPLSYSLIGAPPGAAIDPDTGAFSWTPTEAQGPGTFPFTVRVSDGELTSDQAVTVTVNEVNVPPVLAAITNPTVNELVELTFTASATDVDLPANTLTFSLIGAPTGAAIDPSTGAFSWTPTEAQGPGTANFTVRVSDGSATHDQAVTVTVNEVNVAPVLATIPNKTVNELALLTFTASATDADLPANTLTYSLIGAPTGATINPTTGVFSWTPTEAQGPGSFPVTVSVSDGTTSASRSLTVTVSEVNVAPILAAITDKTVNELAALTFTASATDADLPVNTLTYSLTTAPTGATINPTTGVISWTPTEAQGPGSFPVTVSVSDGTTSATRSLTVTVSEVNVAPVLAAITDKTVDELATLTFTATATDADLPANTLTYSLIGAPTGAAINSSTGAFSWTPNEAQGPNAFTFTVRASDGTLTSDRSLTVTVNEVNTAPVLAAIGNKTINERASLGFTATATDADLPANTLSFSLVGAPTGASIDASSGAFTWTPTAAQGPGSYPFTVKVSDGSLTDEELIRVTILDVTPPALTLPTAVVAEATGPTGAVVNFAIGALDALDGAVSATVTVASGSTFPLGETTVYVTATDAAGNLATGSFTVTVRDTSAPAITLPGNIVVAVSDESGATVNFAVSATDLVAGAVTAVATPPSGSTFPLGTTTVDVSATDAAGNTAQLSFTVTVVTLAELLQQAVCIPAGGSTLASIAGQIRGGPPGGTVVIQAAADLGADDAWEDIGTIQLDASGNATFGPIQDPHSVGLRQDFFRVRLP